MNKKLKILLIALAVLAVLIAVTVVYLYSNGLSGIHHHTSPKEGQIKVACVGDSITYGHGVSGWAQNNYPAKLQEILGDGYHVQNFGHSGRTLSPEGDQPYTESAQYRKSLEYAPDILVFMLGTNDSKPENWTNITDFYTYLSEMLKAYKEANPNVKIYICTPAKAFFVNGESEGLTSFDIQPSVVDTICTVVRTYAITPISNIESLIDVYALTESHPEWFAADGVHPSKEGAQAIAQLVADKITK